MKQKKTVRNGSELVASRLANNLCPFTGRKIDYKTADMVAVKHGEDEIFVERKYTER